MIIKKWMNYLNKEDDIKFPKEGRKHAIMIDRKYMYELKVS